jgi:hypothetical protein
MSDIWLSERGWQARHKLLQLAAAGDDPETAELAREMLAGRVSLRNATHTSAYSEILLSRMDPMLRTWEQLSESERHHARDHAGELLAEAISAIEELPDPERRDAETPVDTRETADDEDFEQRTYLRRP